MYQGVYLILDYMKLNLHTTFILIAKQLAAKYAVLQDNN